MQLGSNEKQKFPRCCPLLGGQVEQGSPVNFWDDAAGAWILAAPAAAEVFSGWVGIAQKTWFGLVSPLPGIWPALHLDTAITLPA